MFKIERTTSENTDFQKLVILLDEDLSIRDGNEHSFYAQFNKIDSIKNVVVFYINDEPVGCGAFKEYDAKTVEIKRMFTQPAFRGKSVGTMVLNELSLWAKELSYSEVILETGKKQPEAIALYIKNNFTVITNYEPYYGVKNSICFKKKL